MRAILYHISIILFFASTNVFALDTLHLKKDFQYSHEISPRKYRAVSKDAALDTLRFIEGDEIQEKVGQVYWQELILTNHLTNHDYFIVEFEDPHIGDLEVYVKQTNKPLELIQSSGFSKVFFDRFIEHKNHASLLQIGKGETLVLYVKYENKVHCGVFANVKPVYHFINYSLKEYIVLGVFYGVLLLLLIYNFVLFFTNKQQYYLWYVVYILFCSINTFNENGLGFQFLWPNYPSLNYLLYEAGSLLLSISFLFYTKSFLGEVYLTWKKTFIVLIVLFLSYFIFKIEYLQHYWAITFLWFYTYIFYISTSGFKKVFKPFSYFNVGNVILLSSFIVLFGRIMGFIPSFWLTVYYFNIGFVIEGVVFSYAMANRLSKAHETIELSQLKMIEELKEKELLKDKVNRELEQKVSERTQTVEQQKMELVKLNDELQEFQKKINYINSELDKDNFKLQKSLVEAKKQKVLKRIVSFEEFNTVFKTDSVCLKHLVELKWSEEFKCKKCKGKNYSLIQKTHNRKCTSCKHIESPTANTLFHGIKFPLNKAFYLVYLTHYSKKESTIDELSQELDLRRNTLWSFRKKVIERKENLLATNKIVVNSPWERLIVD